MDEPPRFDVDNVEGSPRTPKISISSRFSRTSHQCSNAPVEDHLPSYHKSSFDELPSFDELYDQLENENAKGPNSDDLVEEPACVNEDGKLIKKAIFDEHVQVGLVGWAQSAKKKGLRATANGSQAGTKDGSHAGSKDGSTVRIQMGRMGQQQPPREEGDAGKIEPEIQLK